MTQELILTSVSQGLEPDTHGFCVVAENRGIPQQLIRRLNEMSQYRHVFAPDSEEVLLNPVNYSHQVVTLMDRSWHVLSRIADCGTDYRIQPNHLAHHVVLRDDERVTEGPAWVLAQQGFHFTEWQTPSVRFTTGRPLPTLTSPSLSTRYDRIKLERHWLAPNHQTSIITIPGADTAEFHQSSHPSETKTKKHKTMASLSPCPCWLEATNDAGWGGVLAETIRTGQQVVVLYEPGTNLLPFFVEAIALVAPALRWRCTFSTYFTGLPDHVACQWKGILADSPEAAVWKAKQNVLLLDLTQPMGTAPIGPYVEFARHGADKFIPAQEDPSSPFQEEPDVASLAEETAVQVAKGTGGMETSVFNHVEKDTGFFVASAEETTPQQKEDTKPLPRPDVKPSPPPVPAFTQPPAIPPVRSADSPLRIRTEPVQKTKGMFDSILNMESRGGFFLLYGITLLFVLFLSALLLDQLFDFGLARWIRGSQQVVAKPAPAGRGKSDPAKQAELDQKAAAEAVEMKKLREEHEQKKQEAENQKKLRQLQQEFKKTAQQVKKKEEDAVEGLNVYLLDNPLPKFLPLLSPEQINDSVTLPKTQVFPQMIPLHAFGPALDLSLIPLFDLPKLKIETVKKEFFLDPEVLLKDINKEEQNNAEQNNDQVVADQPAAEIGKLDGMGNGMGGMDTKPLPDDEAKPEINFPKVPDLSRFEWTVNGIDKATGVVTPLFQMKLTEKGLSFDWINESPQLFHDALLATLGFLRVGIKGETNYSRINSIPLFQPISCPPLFPVKDLSDPSKPFVVVLPFAKEPWKSLFETTSIPFRFTLKAKVVPDNPSGVEEIVYPEPETPSRFAAEFKTDVSSKRTMGGADTFIPIVVMLDGSTEPGWVVWTDRFPDQVKAYKDELANGKDRLEEMRKEEEDVRKKVFNNTETGKALSDLRKRRNELATEIKVLESRIKEVDDILSKFSSAHDKVAKNDQIQIEYSVFLSLIPTDAGNFDVENQDGPQDDFFAENEKKANQKPKAKDEPIDISLDLEDDKKPVEPKDDMMAIEPKNDGAAEPEVAKKESPKNPPKENAEPGDTETIRTRTEESLLILKTGPAEKKSEDKKSPQSAPDEQPAPKTETKEQPTETE